MSGDLLQTKLYVPKERSFLVLRPHLTQKLDHGVQQGCKLTLVSAPAGFGKTTLVSEWVNQKDKGSIAWLSLDEGDNNPTRFLTYFVAALQTLSLSEFDKVVSMLQSPQLPPTESILTTLINEITAVTTPFIIVLDDYHVIDTQSIDTVLAFLLEHQPPQMHMVIATREDPDLPLARLRVRRQLTELRANDLRFTASEAATFLNQMMGLSLSIEEVTSLETRTEGWIAGLQLAALSMRGREDITGFIRAFAGDNRYIVDYLVEEVLQCQPNHVSSFLLQTSILDRLGGSLCDVVTGQKDGKRLLDTLERDNLFVVPLDDTRHWYRYHHLFADVLQVRLMEQYPERISILHQRASKWYEHNSQPSEAIRHALAGEDFERAADLAELAWPAMSGSFQSIIWLGWLRVLPDELVRVRPVLSVAYAWAYLNGGQLEAAEARLLDAERWLEPTTNLCEQLDAGLEKTPTKMVVVDEKQFRLLPASHATARAYHAQAVGDSSRTLKYAQQVLNLLPEGNPKWRGDATALLALAYWTNGELDSAHRTMSDGLIRMGTLDVIVGTFVLADIKMALGQLREALSAYQHAFQLVADQGEPIPLGTEDLYTGISKLHREQGELETAKQDLLISKKLGELVELPDWQYRWCIAQAQLKETLGALDDALSLLDEAQHQYVRTPLPDVYPIPALKTRIWLKQDKLADALNWIREQGLSANDDISYIHEFEHITLARVLIAQYKSNHAKHAINQAMGLIGRLLQAAEKGGRMGSVIEILVVQSLAHEVQSDIPAALVPLERALSLAEPEGYVRIFADEGPPMARLLYEALSQGTSPNYVQQLLTAFPVEEPEEADSSNTQAPTPEHIEPLSEREIEVLQLISEGLTNQEIATKLYLSLHTVKAHARNIYGKLSVKNRTQAVTKGKALGILSPT